MSGIDRAGDSPHTTSVSLSVVLLTYNGDRQLSTCLDSLLPQLDDGCELVIADDGSASERTRELIESARDRSRCPVEHAWQVDRGFRAARARNVGAMKARGDVLLFLDHDVVVPAGFIRTLRGLMLPGWMCAGRRVKLDQESTEAILDGRSKASSLFSPMFALRCAQARFEGWRYLFPLRDRSPLRGQPQPWRGAAGFCFAVWRDDFLAVDGFDARYEGYGVEDWDLFARLSHHGVKLGYLPRRSTLVHLWHREFEHDLDGPGYHMLDGVLKAEAVKAELGCSTISDGDSSTGRSGR